ncbi:MAG: CehA/McbA family metallohydrolase [Pyrinomonadaceae bacterium]
MKSQVFKIVVFYLCLFGVTPAFGSVELKVELRKPDAAEPQYVMVPFEVPKGARVVSVETSYDRQNGKTKLEFGLFEPPNIGSVNDTRGFRGWSGAIRNSFFVSRDFATPGYMKGKPKTGRWHLLVGMPQMASEMTQLALKISFDDAPSELRKENEAEYARTFTHDESKKTKQPGWLKGDLHSHTIHGDGHWTVAGILDSAVAGGLDFVALTEHNTFAHHFDIAKLQKNYPNVLAIRGQEVTTYGAHINVWGLPKKGWTDFRVVAGSPGSAESIANSIHKRGGLASINHPTMSCGGCNWTYGSWKPMDSVEVWNASWESDDEEALKLWQAALMRGERITAIGSSDTHQPPYEPYPYPINREVGNPTVHVKASRLREKNILEAVRNGNVYVTRTPVETIDFAANGRVSGETASTDSNGGILVSLAAREFPAKAEIRLIVADGQSVSTRLIEASGDGRKSETRLDFNDDGFVRLEIRAENGEMLGFTNPIFVKRTIE